MVSRIRGLIGVRKVGHAGTLDPFADGLLPVCLGRATRVIQFMEHYDKAYRVTVAFGTATDTQDLTGQPVMTHELTQAERRHLLETDFAEVRRVVSELTGMEHQIPPMYSAVKIKGRPLYQYARKGLDIERRPRPVKIYEAILESAALTDILTAELSIRCSKGTYIRSLCDEIGRLMGWGAHAAALRRTACGPWSIDQAISLEQLSGWITDGASPDQRLQVLQDAQLLLPAASALTDLPTLAVSYDAAIALINGRAVLLDTDQPVLQGRFAVCSANRLIAVAELERYNEDAWRIRTERVLIDLADFRRT